MTLILAVIGAVTGIAALLLDLVRFLHERPKLIPTLTIDVQRGSPPLIGIDVANRGGGATTITKASLVAQGETELAKEGVVFATGKLENDLSGGALTVVGPGGVARFRQAIISWPGLLWIDELVRPCVVDAHGRTSWGDAFPLMRAIVSHGWTPPPGTDPQLLTPATEPLRAEPVEPRWKVWKPRSLRRPVVLPPFPES